MTVEEILDAIKSTRFCDIEPGARENMLRKEIENLYNMKSVPLDGEAGNIDLTVRTLESKMRNAYPTLTMGEVSLALKAGVAGELGKDTRITAVNAICWISAYICSNIRKDAAFEIEKKRKQKEWWNRQTQAELPEVKAAKNEAFRVQEPIAAWNQFKSDPDYTIVLAGYGDALYRALRSFGKMGNVKPETMKLCQENARRRFRNSHENEWKASLESSVTFQCHLHTELVLAYFRGLKAAGMELTL